jgi:hypothetical protein
MQETCTACHARCLPNTSPPGMAGMDARKVLLWRATMPDLQHEGELLQHRICSGRPQVAPPRPQHRHQLQQRHLTWACSTSGGGHNNALNLGAEVRSAGEIQRETVCKRTKLLACHAVRQTEIWVSHHRLQREPPCTSAPRGHECLATAFRHPVMTCLTRRCRRHRHQSVQGHRWW